MTIVLLSGGQDSTTCLYWALREGGVRAALFVHYGQRHEREVVSARRIAADAGVTLYESRHALPYVSALTNRYAEIGTRPDGLPTTFVPGRNALFLAVAAGLAKTEGGSKIVIGCSAVDFSGYPDCRPDFILKQQAALAAGCDAPDLSIIAPLIDRSKAQTVRLARELGPDCWSALSHSWTCYLGGEKPCGECPACALRVKGFAEAGEMDPAACLP